jgi:uncharacterized membrane protein YccC
MKLPFGKNVIAGILYGIVLGLILWLIASGLTVTAILPPNSPIALFFIGLAVCMGIAFIED